MLGWLRDKSDNARVVMCIKDHKLELETSSVLHRAKILAMAQLLRHNFTQSFDLDSVVNNPFAYSREELLAVYSNLENLRNEATFQLAGLKKGFANMGYELPDELSAHVKLTNRSLELWMVTLGAGLLSGQDQNIRFVWRLMQGSVDELEQAISEIRDVADRQAEYTGQNIFDDFVSTDQEWLTMCRFSPKWINS